MKRIFLFLLLFSALLSKAQVPASYFGDHILGPTETNLGGTGKSTLWPVWNPSAIRLWDVFAYDGTHSPAYTGLSWRTLNPTNGTYYWTVFDKILLKMKTQGVTDLIYTLGYVPAWAGGGTAGDQNPSSQTYITTFITAVANRAISLGMPIKYWEVWNEPNNGAGTWIGTTAQMVTIAQTISNAVKAVDATYKVLSPSPQGFSTSWSAGFLAAGGGAYCDIMAFHGYMFGHPPEDIATLIDNYKTVYTSNGQGSKPVWNTEAFRLESGDTANTLQVNFLAVTYLLGWVKGLERYYWYSWDGSTTTGQEWRYQNYTGGITGITATGIANQQIINWMQGATVGNLVIAGNVYTIDVTRSGVTSKIVWNKSGSSTYATSYNRVTNLSGTTTAFSGSLTINTSPVLLTSINCPSTGVTAAHNYYFSIECGDDSRTSTQARNPATPWKTIGKLNLFFPSLTAGDSVLFRAGETWSGANAAQITIVKNGVIISSYGIGEKPIISGLVPITGFTAGTGSVYTSAANTSLSTTCNVVLKNGVLQYLGRYPNASAANNGYLTYESHSGLTSITDAQGLALNWKNAFCVVRTNKFTRDGAVVSNQAGGTLTFATSLQATPVNGSGFFFNRSLQTLDSAGEWYYAASTKKISMYLNTTPTNVTASAIDNLVLSSGFSNVTIHNIDFEGANLNAINITNGSGWVIKNCTFNFAGERAIQDEGSDNITIQSCTTNYALSDAIRLHNVTGALVTGSTMTNNATLTGMNAALGQIGDGINHRGSSSTFSLNNIINTGYSPIFTVPNSVGGNMLVQNNLCDTFCVSTNDGGGIYTVNTSGVTSTNNKIIGNIVMNGIGAMGGQTDNFTSAEGIYLDNSASNWTVSGNTVFNTQRAIYVHYGTNNIIRNNTTFHNKYGAYFQSSKTPADPSGTIRFVRSCQNKANKYIGRDATEYTGWFSTDTTAIFWDLSKFFISGGCDSNYYTRPLNETTTSATMRNSSTNVSLASWKTAYGSPTNYDVHSKLSVKTATNVNQFIFLYNATTSQVDVPLSGNWVDVANVAYSGAATLQPYTSVVLLPSAGLITPVIIWSDPAAITYPTPLSATQLNATVTDDIPGTFTYTPAIPTVLNGGTQTLSVLFTPTDGTTYSTATKSVTIVVNKASATMSYSNLTQTYTGLPLAPTVTTNPSGLTTVNTTYNGVGATPINAGSYALLSALTNQNYTAPNITGTFTINKAAATMTASNLNQTYNGSPKPITVVTNPVGLSGVSVTYNGSATVPTNAGTYTVVVTLTNTNYTATTINTTLVINKAVPTVSWSNPAAITYPTALSGTQLNATASVSGTFSYSPPSGTVLNAGTNTLSVDFTPTDGTNYSVVNGTSVTIVVNKGTATLSLSNTTQTYDGTGKAVTVTSSPVGLNTITVTYDGSTTLPVNAGSYAVSASLNNTNYTATPATGILTINKAVATLFISGLSATYNFTPHPVTVTTVPAGLTTVSVTYDGSGTAPQNAGSYAVVATLTNTNYQGTASGTLVINKMTPVVNWNNPSAITYPAPLTSTQLNASANASGTFTYTPPSGTILNAGTQTLSVDFTPTDASNINSVTNVTVTIVVNKAVATLSLLNLAQQYDGNPKPVTVVTSPAGLNVVAVTYNGSGTAPTAVGTYPVIATLTNSNYTATPATGNLIISASVAAVTITDLLQTYTGSPLDVTVTVMGGYPYDLTYNGSASAPTNVGSYVAIATINDGIHTGSDTATFVIVKATPSITWANPSNITFSTALSGTQLNATSPTAGVFTYTPASGTILNAGSHLLSVSFAPTDNANYNNTSKTVTIVVDKATATISLSNLTQQYDGTQKRAIAITSPAGLDEVTITYAGSTTAPSAVGVYKVVATLVNSNYDATPAEDSLHITTASASISISNLLQTYTGSQLPITVTTNPNGLSYTTTYNGSATVPTNAGSYTVISTLTGGIYQGADTATYVIQKATPTVTWNNPSAITYGTALSGTQLNASSSVAGTFAYSPISGTVLNAGTSNLSTTFTPTDATNYNSVTKIVTIVVNKAAATLTLGSLVFTYNGTAKPVSVTSSPSGLALITVTYNGSSTAPTTAGSYNVVASLTNDNYTASNVTGVEVIAKANPSITWVNPTAIQSGTALSSLQLNATANIAGTFVYTPTFGDIPPTGTMRLSALFTPNDSVNYNAVTITVPLSVFGSPFQDYYLRHGHVNYSEFKQ